MGLIDFVISDRTYNQVKTTAIAIQSRQSQQERSHLVDASEKIGDRIDDV